MSLAKGFTILFSFKEGLIPWFLYLFNVKTDTVKVLLNPDKNIRKRMKNELNFDNSCVWSPTPQEAQESSYGVRKIFYVKRIFFFFFGLRLPASHRRKQFVHGKEACVDDRSTSSRVFPDKFPPEQTNSLLEQGTNKQSRNTASKALKLSAMHRTWVLYLGLEVLVWFVFFLWWWVQFDCFSLKQTPQKRAVYPSTLYLSK